jgi:hypothetical protein
VAWSRKVRGIDLGISGRVVHVAGSINWRWHRVLDLLHKMSGYRGKFESVPDFVIRYFTFLAHGFQSYIRMTIIGYLTSKAVYWSRTLASPRDE